MTKLAPQTLHSLKEQQEWKKNVIPFIPKLSELVGTLVIEAGLCLINFRLDGMSGAYASGTGLTHRPFKPQTHCHNVLEENPAERRNPQALDLITATATPS